MRRWLCASRAIGAIQNFVSIVDQPHFHALVKADYMKRVVAEKEELLPHLAVLNAEGLPTPGSKSQLDSKHSLFKRQKTEVRPTPSVEAIQASAEFVYDWLNKGGKSAIRGLMLLCGSNGLSHNSQSYDKALRAHIEARSVDKIGFVQLMHKRFESAPASASSAPGRGELAELGG